MVFTRTPDSNEQYKAAWKKTIEDIPASKEAIDKLLTGYHNEINATRGQQSFDMGHVLTSLGSDILKLSRRETPAYQPANPQPVTHIADHEQLERIELTHFSNISVADLDKHNEYMHAVRMAVPLIHLHRLSPTKSKEHPAFTALRDVMKERGLTPAEIAPQQSFSESMHHIISGLKDKHVPDEHIHALLDKNRKDLERANNSPKSLSLALQNLHKAAHAIHPNAEDILRNENDPAVIQLTQKIRERAQAWVREHQASFAYHEEFRTKLPEEIEEDRFDHGINAHITRANSTISSGISGLTASIENWQQHDQNRGSWRGIVANVKPSAKEKILHTFDEAIHQLAPHVPMPQRQVSARRA